MQIQIPLQTQAYSDHTRKKPWSKIRDRLPNEDCKPKFFSFNSFQITKHENICWYEEKVFVGTSGCLVYL